MMRSNIYPSVPSSSDITRLPLIHIVAAFLRVVSPELPGYPNSREISMRCFPIPRHETLDSGPRILISRDAMLDHEIRTHETANLHSSPIAK